jgi:hypothetical protein
MGDTFMNMMTLQVQVSIRETMIRDLLVTAFEGGSNYWIDEVGRPEFTKEMMEASKKLDEEDGFENGPLYNSLLVGGTLYIDFGDEGDGERRRLTINMDHAKSGLEILSRKYPHHFADILADNHDAGTADAWLQCVCFGELIYG